VLQRNRCVLVAFAGLCFLVSVPGCLTEPEEARYPEQELEPARPARRLPDPVPQSAVAKSCPGSTRHAEDGLIDDLEDGDSRIASAGGRTGYWWVAKADHALVTIPAGAFASSDGGVEGSKKAARFVGKTDSRDPWGAAVGVNFLESGALYDASKYAGVAFRIRASRPNVSVRVKLPDVSSLPEGGLCVTACWNSFGKDLVAGPEWQNVVVTWGELSQEPNWGDPRPPAISVGKIKDIEWAVSKGVEFDLVVDDIHFIECA
jgi:endoglucanase